MLKARLRLSSPSDIVKLTVSEHKSEFLDGKLLVLRRRPKQRLPGFKCVEKVGKTYV